MEAGIIALVIFLIGDLIIAIFYYSRRQKRKKLNE